VPQVAALNITLPERVYAADVSGPMAVFALADRHVKIFKLDGNPLVRVAQLVVGWIAQH